MAVLPLWPADRRPGAGRAGPRRSPLAGAILSAGFFPPAGLREPLERHRHSVLNHLVREKRAERYMARLDTLASALSTSEDSITFDTWASRSLSYDESRRPEVPDRSTPRDAPVYAQATWTNAENSSPTGQTCRRTKASGNSAGTTTRAGTSPSTSPATTPGCPRNPAGHCRPQDAHRAQTKRRRKMTSRRQATYNRFPCINHSNLVDRPSTEENFQSTFQQPAALRPKTDPKIGCHWGTNHALTTPGRGCYTAHQETFRWATNRERRCQTHKKGS